ncbi:MAG: hypothetical protein FWG13_02340 [Leptospirales bacterium]|nr:hypothetical protein [Leptospirales bacterium]
MKGKIDSVLNGKYWALPFLVMLVFFTAMRFMNIKADAPQDLSISAALYTDEGFKTYSSRNHKYYGDWKWTPVDNYGGWYKRSGIPAYLYRGWFEVFGVSFVSMKTPTILLAALSMALIFFMVKRFYDIYTAYVAFTLFGFNHFLIMYSRLAFYENFLIFFSILSFWMGAEFFRKLHYIRIERKKRHVAAEIFQAFLFLTLMLFFIFCGFLSKESMNILIVSIIPFGLLYFFYSRLRLTSFVVHTFYFIVILITVAYIIAGHSRLFDTWFTQISGIRIFDLTMGNLIPLKTGVSNFDPIYLSFLKSLFLEFIYNQPLTFFSGMAFVLICYFKFLYQSKCNAVDMALSTWIIFCFIFLSIMKYHPARYFLLLSPPLMILSARFIASMEYVNLLELSKKLKVKSFRILAYIFWFYFIFYVGVTFFLQAIPFFYRKKLYDFFYTNLVKGNIDDVLPVIFLVVFIQIFFFVLLVPKIKFLNGVFEKKKTFAVLFIAIICFQSFLHIKWLVTGKSKLYNISVKLGETLNPDSILFGGWGPGLAVENSLRSIVIQGGMGYNTDVLKTLLDKKKIPVVKKKNDITVRTYESRMPLYLFVSPNAPFEKKMCEFYKNYLTARNKVFSTEFGYFNIEMYRLDREPAAEKKKMKDFKP